MMFVETEFGFTRCVSAGAEAGFFPVLFSTDLLVSSAQRAQ
jgi:hypothetical protein